jgi:DNA repair protein SbcC/Rad50
LRDFIDALDEKDKEKQKDLQDQNNQIIGELHAFQSQNAELMASFNKKDTGARLDEILTECQAEVMRDETQLPTLQKAMAEYEAAKESLLANHQKIHADNINLLSYQSAQKEEQGLLAQKDEMSLAALRLTKGRDAALVVAASKESEQLQKAVASLLLAQLDLALRLPKAQAAFAMAMKERDEKKPAYEKEQAESIATQTKLLALKDKLTALAQAELAWTSAKKALDEATISEAKAKAALDACQNRYSALNNQVNGYVDDGSGAKAQLALASLADTAKSLASLTQDKSRYDQAKNELTLAQNKYQALQKEALDKESEYSLSLKAYLDEQAGVLAEHLLPNEPCPVCGALDHPHPASKKGVVLSREAIASLKAVADNKQKAAEEAAHGAEGKKATLVEKEESLGKAYALLSDKPFAIASFEADVSALLSSNALAVNEQKKIVASAQEKADAHEADKRLLVKEEEALNAAKIIEQRAQAEKENAATHQAEAKSVYSSLFQETQGIKSETLEGQLAHLAEVLAHDKKQLASLDEAYNSSKSAYDTLAEQEKTNARDLPLKQQELKVAEEAFSALLAEKGFATLDEAKKDVLDNGTLALLDNQVQTYQNQASGVKAILSEGVKAGYDKLVAVDESGFSESELAARSLAQSSSDGYNALASKVKANEGCLARIRERRKAAAELFEQASEIHRLAQTADGKLTGGSAHIDFEVYYQAQIFEQILSSASKKFSVMSDGRYLLQRRDVPTSNSGQFGLDIDVKDFQTGKIRPVSSLSGGESFMASLSLALSLSEIIQQKAGGIELDSMFIDEGFGTLDPESLSLAIKVLNNLSSNSHRMIGIISHVETLKNAIPAQIEVSKSSKGSEIKCFY